MKKRISLIFTFIISFILLINNVNAAKELTCVYGEGITQSAVKLIQDKDGKLYTYRSVEYKEESTIWVPFELPETSFKFENQQKNNSNFYDEQNKVLNSCPTCLNYETPLIGKDKIEAYNKTGDNCKSGYVPLEKEIAEATIDEKNKDFKEKMQEYKMNYCRYKIMDDRSYLTLKDGSINVELYYNESSFHFNYSYNSEFNINKILASNDGRCPEELYSYYHASDASEEFYLNKPDSNIDWNRKWLLVVDKRYDTTSTEQRPSAPENGCQLLGDTTIGLIDDIMKAIRIVVPILLIVLGITDFFRATFSDSEDNMKKDRDRFIKRIIAAIIVFIVPMFVHLVLNIANSVWGEISPETCIK